MVSNSDLLFNNGRGYPNSCWSLIFLIWPYGLDLRRWPIQWMPNIETNCQLVQKLLS